MQKYVIGSQRIQIAKTHKRNLAKCEYDQQKMLDYFQYDQPMKVFKSLKDAQLYAEASRKDRRNSPFVISEMHAYPIYKVELHDDLVLTEYQAKQEKSDFVFDSGFQNKLAKDENNQFYLFPEYYEVPADAVVKVLSVMDFYENDKEMDLLNLHHEDHAKKCYIM